LEFRDPDWLQEPIYEILRYHGGEHGEYPYQKMETEARRVERYLDVHAFF
jgi:hypothetical protein